MHFCSTGVGMVVKPHSHEISTVCVGWKCEMPELVFDKSITRGHCKVNDCMFIIMINLIEELSLRRFWWWVSFGKPTGPHSNLKNLQNFAPKIIFESHWGRMWGTPCTPRKVSNTPEMNELGADENPLKIWTYNFKKQKSYSISKSQKVVPPYVDKKVDFTTIKKNIFYMLEFTVTFRQRLKST